MRQINLLPPELAAKRRTRQTLGALVAGGVVVVVLLGILYAAQQARLAGQRRALDRQRQTNTGLQRQVTQLSQFSRQQEELRTKASLLQTLTRTEVRWSVVLTEISLVIPIDDWLTTFTGTVASGAAQATVPGAGSIQLAGCTLLHPDGTHLNVAQFLVQIAKPLEFADDPFLTLSTKAEVDSCPVQFTAQVALTDQARRTAQRGGERQV
ncbi:MAG: PilN domain-containing protein [Actinomycetota bacterium]